VSERSGSGAAPEARAPVERLPLHGFRRRRRIGFWYRLAATILRPVFTVLTRRVWHGAEHLPTDGGYVAAVNHLSYVDPFTFAHFMFDNGHLPRFLAKESLFRTFFIGNVMRGAHQIPVYRTSGDALSALSAAVAAVKAGECVAIYPEATLTRDPDLWPMQGKTGAARVALASGRPVIPIAQWGAQEILPPYRMVPRLFPRHTSHVSAGPPVDLSRFAGRELTPEEFREATDAILDAITELLAGIRHQQPPSTRWHPTTGGVPRYGNPNRRPRGRGRRNGSAAAAGGGSAADDAAGGAQR
jgi:1-acyl-sn-glycerol-3-phosphate acyltransferase